MHELLTKFYQGKNKEINIDIPNFKPFIMYTEGSYFGDHDIIPEMSLRYDGMFTRDSTCIIKDKSSLFSLDIASLKKLKKAFKDIFEEMIY